jgi:hypothetical protein
MKAVDVLAAVEDALAVRDELVARGEPMGSALVITGCALGVLMAGART